VIDAFVDLVDMCLCAAERVKGLREVVEPVIIIKFARRLTIGFVSWRGEQGEVEG